MKIKPLILIICMTATYGCSKQSAEQTVPIEELSSIVVPAADDCNLFSPIIIKNDTVIGRSINPDYLFTKTVITPEGMNGDEGIYKNGHGPYEAKGAALSSDKDGNLYILKTDYGRVCALYKIPDDSLLHSPEQWIRFPLQNLPLTRHGDITFVVVDDDNIMIIGDTFKNPSSIVSLIDYKRQELKPVGLWPDDGFSGNPYLKLKVYASNASLFSNNNGKYVFTTRDSEYSVIFTLKDDKAQILKYIYNTPIEYREDAPDKVKFLPPKTFAIRASADQTGIYILHLDKDLKHQVPSSPSYDVALGDRVDVFDWEGNLSRSIKLDNIGYDIHIANNGTTLYMLFLDPDTGQMKVAIYDIAENKQ